MISLTLYNLRVNSRQWQIYHLMPTSIEMGEIKGEIFETDQIKFELKCPVGATAARIYIGDAEVRGVFSYASEEYTSFTFSPRINQKFGYDSFFLHYCGIANISARYDLDDKPSQQVLFDALCVSGRKVTADRIRNILEYLSKHITTELLEALSPTQYSASLANNGVSLAEKIQRLEQTLMDISDTVRTIAFRPIRYLRPSMSTISDPTPEKLSGGDMEWVIDNAGQAIESDSPDSALFYFGFKWRTLPEIHSTAHMDSTDVEENRIIRHYLFILRATASELVAESRVEENNGINLNDYDDSVYMTFYFIANKILGDLSIGYQHRAAHCLMECQRLIKLFDAKVSTSHRKPLSVKPTQKMRANQYYMNMARSMKDWLDKREVIWLEKIFFSSINSTWRLFEYYTVISTHQYLHSISSNDKIGLFKGNVGNSNIKLMYEPSIPVIKNAKPEDPYVIVDRLTSGKRTPDIVIEISPNDGSNKTLLILDAKCRQERDVWDELNSCERKYTSSIRDSNNGRQVVSALVMLYPKTSQHSNSQFQDYYHRPYGMKDPYSCEPILGIQRMVIDNEGIEQEFHQLLGSLIHRFEGKNKNQLSQKKIAEIAGSPTLRQAFY
jgi:hypothetical protein